MGRGGRSQIFSPEIANAAPLILEKLPLVDAAPRLHFRPAPGRELIMTASRHHHDLNRWASGVLDGRGELVGRQQHRDGVGISLVDAAPRLHLRPAPGCYLIITASRHHHDLNMTLA